MKSLVEARLKRVRAVELASEGKSYEEIASEVGFKHRGSAHRAVSRALADREAEGVDELRALELDRLDALQVALWDDAMAGDPTAAMAVLRIVSMRSRLLGLLGPGGDRVAEEPRYLVMPREGNTVEATAEGWVTKARSESGRKTA